MLNRFATLKILFLILMISTVFFKISYAEDLKRIVNLQGFWYFTIGDNPAWAETEYDHEDWGKVFVPMRWEDQGYNNYNGFAWYRKSFTMPQISDDEIIYLKLGYIDDADEVYINGQLIGSTGKFPPENETAYNIQRKYFIPRHLLKEGKENVIAIRVFDEYFSGGIVNGKVGLYFDMDNDLLELNLAGYWKFKQFDQSIWKNPGIDDSFWKEIYVPGFWENSGYHNYDGFAWYRKEFELPESLRGKDLVLILGRIDDIDYTYFNGKRIGSVDEIAYTSFNQESMRFRVFRGYEIPVELLKFGEKNLIAVRVFDEGIQGGIYEGPIGITTLEKFEILKNKYAESESMLEYIIKSLFEY